MIHPSPHLLWRRRPVSPPLTEPAGRPVNLLPHSCSRTPGSRTLFAAGNIRVRFAHLAGKSRFILHTYRRNDLSFLYYSSAPRERSRLADSIPDPLQVHHQAARESPLAALLFSELMGKEVAARPQLESLVGWLPMCHLPKLSDFQQNLCGTSRNAWSCCVVRRLHGETPLGE